MQIVDSALDDAARRSGSNLFCHPGCTPCCHGVFAISSLDAERLRAGLALLSAKDSARADALRERIRAAQEKLTPDYPGDLFTGHLGTDEASQERFEAFGNDEPCPVLDPEIGTCDLYLHRPMTCRAFGPPVATVEGIGLCELCFRGATQEEITAAELHLPDPSLENALTGMTGAWSTIVAFAFELTDLTQALRQQVEMPLGNETQTTQTKQHDDDALKSHVP